MGVQQRGGGAHQHAGGLGVVVGWVKQQAEVAVRHPAGHKDLAVGVCAELRHRPRSPLLVDGWRTRLPGRTRTLTLSGQHSFWPIRTNPSWGWSVFGVSPRAGPIREAVPEAG